MNISAASLSFAKSAERLIDDIVQNNHNSAGDQSSKSGSASSNSATSSSGPDTVDFSPAATAVLSGQTSTQTAALPTDINGAAEDALGEGQSTSFSTTYSANGMVASQTVTGALASIVNQINTTGTVAAQPGETAAQLNFANVYATQKSEGLVGSFYDNSTASQYNFGMSSAEAASFTAAFNNRTLDIQTAQQAGIVVENAQGGAYTGSQTSTTSFSESAIGGGETGSYTGDTQYWNSSAVQQRNQYGLYTGSLIFGGFVVSWGGPATAQTTTA